MNKKYFEEDKNELYRVMKKLEIIYGVKPIFNDELSFDDEAEKLEALSRNALMISRYFREMARLLNDMADSINDESETN